MDQSAFKLRYATNERRVDIFGEFLIYLDTVKHFLSSYSLVVFGSFVEDKETPSDIDLILHGYVKDEMLSSFQIQKLQSQGRIHVKLEVSAMKSSFKLRNHLELVLWFEESNPGKKVHKYEAINF